MTNYSYSNTGVWYYKWNKNTLLPQWNIVSIFIYFYFLYTQTLNSWSAGWYLHLITYSLYWCLKHENTHNYTSTNDWTTLLIKYSTLHIKHLVMVWYPPSSCRLNPNSLEPCIPSKWQAHGSENKQWMHFNNVIFKMFYLPDVCSLAVARDRGWMWHVTQTRASGQMQTV